MCEATSHTTISNLTQAEEFLNRHYCNYTLNVASYVDEILTHRDTWTDFTDIEDDINGKLHVYHRSCFVFTNRTVLEAVKVCFDCVIFNKLHDFLIPLLYQQFEKDDRYFFNKCRDLCNANVTAEQLGAPENYAIPLLAAVVELASLDNHRSPLEKLHCLCTTYDLIFAELKTALIDIISRYSVTENDIPVIDNSDIIPILMMVIVRSKLIHLSSNIYYIEAFSGCLSRKDNIRHVLNTFKEAINRLQATTRETLKPGCDQVCRDLDLTTLVEVTNKMNSKMHNEVMTPLDGQMLRITNLIVTSTNANQPLL